MRSLLPITFLLTFFMSYSQIKYEPGYFIENNGNKVDCLILNIAWRDSPKEFEYKLTADDVSQKKSKDQIAEFNVSGYKYRRFDVTIDRSSTTLGHHSTSSEPKWEKMTVFLKVLVEGKISLLEYSEPNMSKYFFSKENIHAEQLLYREYNENDIIRTNNAFRQQLFNEMKDSKNKGDFERLRYNKKELVRLFVSYNGDKGNNVNYTKSHNKASTHLSILAGAGIANLTTDNVLNIYDYDFDPGQYLTAGLQVEYVLPFNNNKWSIFAAPSFELYNDKADNSLYGHEVKYTALNIPFGGRHYMFLNEKSKLFVNAVYVVSIPMGESYLQYNDIKLDFTNSASLAIGGGYSYGPISAEVRYAFKKELLGQQLGRSASYSTIGLLLGYKLF